jgi:hypothetical protein
MYLISSRSTYHLKVCLLKTDECKIMSSGWVYTYFSMVKVHCTMHCLLQNISMLSFL